jgi:hypothetical protein
VFQGNQVFVTCCAAALPSCVVVNRPAARRHPLLKILCVAAFMNGQSAISWISHCEHCITYRSAQLMHYVYMQQPQKDTSARRARGSFCDIRHNPLLGSSRHDQGSNGHSRWHDTAQKESVLPHP